MAQTRYPNDTSNFNEVRLMWHDQMRLKDKNRNDILYENGDLLSTFPANAFISGNGQVCSFRSYNKRHTL